MVDIVSPKKRSQMMSGIRGKDTKPEMLIRKNLHLLGFRYNLHNNRLPGKPDIVFPKYRAIVFVNGCFWHQHDCHLFKWPSTRKAFWQEKITRTRQRDEENLISLEASNWRVMIVWECALKGRTKLPLDCITSDIANWLCSEEGRSEIMGKSN